MPVVSVNSRKAYTVVRIMGSIIGVNVVADYDIRGSTLSLSCKHPTLSWALGIDQIKGPS